MPPVCEAKLLNVLFPHLAALRIEGLSHDEGMVCVRARADAEEAPCPACGTASAGCTAGTNVGWPTPRWRGSRC